MGQHRRERIVRVLLSVAIALAAASALSAPAAQAFFEHPYLSQITGTPGGSFQIATGVAVDPATQDVYIADANGESVDIFNSSGVYQSQITSLSVPAGDGFAPVSVAVSDKTGYVYVVSDPTDIPNVVYVFNALGGYVTDITGTPAGPFAEGLRRVAVDNSTEAGDPNKGDVYVVDEFHGVVDRFNSANIYQSHLELPGKAGPTSVAVDSSGDVYVTDSKDVFEFNSSGTVVLHLTGTPSGAFGSLISIAVDSGGNIYVSDGVNLTVDEFESSGTFVDETSGSQETSDTLNGPPGGPLHNAHGAAVNAAGDLYVTNSTESGSVVDVFGPNIFVPRAVSEAATGVTPTAATLHGTVNPEGVEVSSCELEYRSEAEPAYGHHSLPCSKTPAEIGAGSSPVPVEAPLGSLTPDTTYYVRVVASNAKGTEGGVDYGATESFSTPGPPTASEESSANVTKVAATLQAKIDPHGFATTSRFQFVTEARFKQDGETFGAGTVSTAESGSVGEDFSEHLVSAAIGVPSPLSPETTYHFRVVVENECESGKQCVVDGEDATFTTEPPLRIDSTYSSEVASTSAALDAQINPLGEAASYRFEYLTEAEYQADGESFSGADQPTSVPVPDGPIASGDADVTVSQSLEALTPATAYRYRVVAANVPVPAGLPGPVLTFTTQAAGSSTAALVLPDDRAWEMVSPAEKNGGAPTGQEGSIFETVIQAAAGGESITYGSKVAFADPAGSPPGNQYLSTRGSGGWSTENIGVPLIASNYDDEGTPPYRFFSSDLSAGLFTNGPGPGVEHTLLPAPLPRTEAAPGAANYYVRDNTTGAFTAVLTEANLQEAVHPVLPLKFKVATPDLRHIVFEEQSQEEGNHHGKGNLYEWSEGAWQLLNLLPGSTQPTQGVSIGNGGVFADPREISTDGSRVVWTQGTSGVGRGKFLYLRENATREQSALNGDECAEPEMACTVQIDAPEAHCGTSCGRVGGGDFLTASADDSKIFFTDQQKLTKESTVGDLYVFEPEGEAGKPKLTDLTIDHNPGQNAEVAGVLGASVDGSYLYFVADGVLSGVQQNGQGAEAQAGQPNLYLAHEGAITFVATLAPVDDNGNGEPLDPGYQAIDWSNVNGVTRRTVRISADGRHVLFDSYRPLTGYDNDAANGVSCGHTRETLEPLPLACSEVFLYEAPAATVPAGHLACISCNPTGERPSGPSGIPGATQFSTYEGLYDSRVLSANSRRVLFDSFDALVPQDTNGTEDVYEWEAAGEGSCVQSSSTYSSASGGCVNLISSGASSENSEFADASENGADVFFLTGQSLVPSDPGSVDLYDARVGGGFPEPPPPPSCEGDACQSPGSPPNAPTLGTSVTSGSGNLAPSAPPPGVKKVAKKTVKCKKPKKLSHGKCVKVKTKKQKAKKSNRRGK